MKVVDPGHVYSLQSLDGYQINTLIFVKREGEGYPGNVGHHSGTTMQECLRALIDRAKYVNNQIPCEETSNAIKLMTEAIFALESRAAHRHNRIVWFTPEEAVTGTICDKCGHIGCSGDCRHKATTEHGAGD